MLLERARAEECPMRVGSNSRPLSSVEALLQMSTEHNDFSCVLQQQQYSGYLPEERDPGFTFFFFLTEKIHTIHLTNQIIRYKARSNPHLISLVFPSASRSFTFLHFNSLFFSF